MSVSVELNGVTHELPTADEQDWGEALTSFLQAIPAAIDAGGETIVAGAGLTKTGSTLDVVAADSTITVNANSIQLAAGYKAKVDATSGTNSGDVTLTAVGSSPSANGASLSGQALTLQPADGTSPGVITAGAQTIGGAKTFSSTVSASNLSGTNTGDVTIGTANGLSLVGQALSLAAATSSNAGAMTATYADKLDGLCVFVAAGSSAAQLQAAIDSLSGVGTVFIEKGTIALGTTTINVDGHIIIQGAGQQATFITYTGSGTAFQVNSGLAIESLKVSIRDMTIDGTNAGSGGAYGITLGQTSVSPFGGAGYFANITLKRFSTAGVRLVYSPATMWFRCNFESNKDGFWSDPTTANAQQHQLFFGCQFLTNTQRGAYIQQADQFQFFTCRFEDNGREGCLLEYPNNASTVFRFCKWDNCYFEDNSTSAANTYNDIYFPSLGSFSHQNHWLINCRFQGSNTAGNVRFNKGTFYEHFCEFSPVSTNNIKIDSSTVAFVYTRNIRDPATYITAGANAPSVHIREGNGSIYYYFNVSGTITLRDQFTSSAVSLGHAAAPGSNVGQLSLGSALNNCKLALFDSASGADSGIAGFGLQSGDVRFFLNATSSKWSWRGTASGASVMELTGLGALTLGGAVVPTVSSTDTQTNKTFTTPTINGCTTSGTWSGNPTFSGNPIFSGTVTMSGNPIVYDAANTLTAFAGGGQASATALTGEVNYVTTVATAADSVKLPTSALGVRIVVFNLGANSTRIFPQTGGAIDALGTNNGYDLAAGASCEFWGQSATQWRSRL